MFQQDIVVTPFEREHTTQKDPDAHFQNPDLPFKKHAVICNTQATHRHNTKG